VAVFIFAAVKICCLEDAAPQIFFLGALRPNAGHVLLILEVSRSHTTTRHIRYDSSGRVISASQRPLPDSTQHSQQRNPCPRWDSNTQSQRASGRRPMPYIARLLGPAHCSTYFPKISEQPKVSRLQNVRMKQVPNR